MRKALVIGLGAALVLMLGVGLVLASDSTPAKEPDRSPFFEATLQQAVDELDGKVRRPSQTWPRAVGPEQAYYTDNAQIWPECTSGYTRDLTQWPWCHYTSDASVYGCDTAWPTKDYTWDQNLWAEGCGPEITQDPARWCNPEYTTNPETPQCNPEYTSDPVGSAPWCDPLYTWDAERYGCPVDEPYYTYDPTWPECEPEMFTSDPFLWAECHYTSDSLTWPQCVEPLPTQDYTSSPFLWVGCPGPGYTEDPQQWPWCNFTYDEVTCNTYTQDSGRWPWCASDTQSYTSDPRVWHECHYTSEPNRWGECAEPFPTKDYTFDSNLWPECDGYTYNGHFMCDLEYTYNNEAWPWCASNWTWDPWDQCAPGYTNSAAQWTACDSSPKYTDDPGVWNECGYQTADPGVWPACQYTSDPGTASCAQIQFPTKDYTNDPQLWPRDCGESQGDLGDAPDRTNHTALPGGNMTAYPGIDSVFPTVFDPITDLAQGPKHWQPSADAWLGPAVTLEFDADLLPDGDGVTNLDPSGNSPDRDGGDDGVGFPIAAPHCAQTWFTYTVTIPAGSVGMDRYVNVWFDWTQDGDWEDIPTCTPPNAGPAPEWAVKDQLIPGGFPPGTYVFATPLYLSWFPNDPDPKELWMRISIAEEQAPLDPGTAIADGRGPSGGYEYGETEDYFFTPICPEPVADFFWDPPAVCPVTTVQFWDNSTSPLAIWSWSWDFGDGQGTSFAQNPTYKFETAGAGMYAVSLTVHSPCGPATTTKTLTVSECPHDVYLPLILR